MEFLKSIIKDEVTAVGLSKFRDKSQNFRNRIGTELNLKKQAFKPNYNNNFFLL